MEITNKPYGIIKTANGNTPKNGTITINMTYDRLITA